MSLVRVWSVPLALALASCVADDVTMDEAPILGGAEADVDSSGVVLFDGGCNGVFVGEGMVLTSAACAPALESGVWLGARRATVGDVEAISASITRVWVSWDVVGAEPPFRVMRGHHLPAGASVLCYGYGRSHEDGGAGVLRTASVQVSDVSRPFLVVRANAAGQVPWIGDEGAGCFDETGQLAVIVQHCNATAAGARYCLGTPVAPLIDSLSGSPLSGRGRYAISPCGFTPGRTSVGDFDGDGGDDLLCDQGGTTTIHYRAAHWRERVTPSRFCSAPGATVHIGDYDGDGRDDRLCHETTGRILVDYADDSGALGEHDWMRDGGYCSHAGAVLLVGDYDGNGRDDLLCHDREGRIWIDRASPAGRFNGHDWFQDGSFCTHDGARLVVGAFNDDARSDLLCIDREGRSWIDFASTTGTFASHDWFRDRGACTAPGQELIVDDMNGDGRDDLLCLSSGVPAIDFASPSGRFEGVDYARPRSTCEGGVGADFDADGDADLICGPNAYQHWWNELDRLVAP